MGGNTIDISVMLIGNVDTLLFSDIPKTDGGIPGAGHQKPGKFIVPDKSSDVHGVGVEDDALVSFSIPYSDALIIRTRSQDTLDKRMVYNVENS